MVNIKVLSTSHLNDIEVERKSQVKFNLTPSVYSNSKRVHKVEIPASIEKSAGKSRSPMKFKTAPLQGISLL